MSKKTMRIVLKHNYPFFDEEDIIQEFKNNFPFEIKEFHLKGRILIIKFEQANRKIDIGLIIDERIIQINIKESMPGKEHEVFEFITHFPEQVISTLQPQMFVVEEMYKETNQEDFNYLMNKETGKMKMKMFGIDFEDELHSYRATVQTRKHDIKLICAVKLESENINLLADEIKKVQNEINKEIFPQLKKYLERE